MDPKRLKAKDESPEETEKRRAWIARLRDGPMPHVADDETVARFLFALESYRTEEAKRAEYEGQLATARARLSAMGPFHDHDFTRADGCVQAHLMPKGDAWEGPEE